MVSLSNHALPGKTSFDRLRMGGRAGAAWTFQSPCYTGGARLTFRDCSHQRAADRSSASPK